MSPTPEPTRGISVLRTITLMIVSFGFMFVLGSFYSIARSGAEEMHRDDMVMAAHTLGMALYAYAKDHNGKYPQGRSSTEIFQQLVDQKYVTDPALFYFPMKGKSKAVGMKLNPENVCWDVTDAVVPDDPDDLPLIFKTGCKISYIPGGKAQPLIDNDKDVSAAFYKDGSARLELADPSGGIPLIDLTFDPKGKTYRQLTPDGPLP